MIERLQLDHFTAFEKLNMEFSPGINILIGKNGTGKTHILKILYTALAALYEEARVPDKMARVFLPRGKNIGRLVKRKRDLAEVISKGLAEVKITRNKKILRLKLSCYKTDTFDVINRWKYEKIAPPVYIPVKEMLANAPGFLSLYKNREIHFEEVYADIISKAFVPKTREISPNQNKLLKLIQKEIEGKVILKNEQFFLKNRQGELEFTLLAEGMRKLGLLWLLIQNGTLIKGSTLFWDEPEANLNPKIAGTVIEIMLELQRMGVQVFLATHDYVILKEFDLRKRKNDEIEYHALFRDEDSGEITLASTNEYLSINPSTIAETFSDLYDRDIKRALEGRNRG